MLKSYKKITSILLALLIMFSFNMPAIASNSATAIDSNTISKVNSALNYVSTQKEQFGLGNVDFSTLSIGNKISAYKITEEGELKPIDFCLYPLTSNGNLVTFAVKMDDCDNFTITNALVDTIKSQVTADEAFALVYDNSGCYIYSHEQLSKIGSFAKISNRGVIDNINTTVLLSAQLNSYRAVQNVEYKDDQAINALTVSMTSSLRAVNINFPMTIMSNYISLPVLYVAQ